VVLVEELSKDIASTAHEFALAVVIDCEGVPVPAFELVVGIGVVWSTPERDIAPPAAPSVPTVPLSVT